MARIWNCPDGRERALARACVQRLMSHFSLKLLPGSVWTVVDSLKGSKSVEMGLSVASKFEGRPESACLTRVDLPI